MLRRLTAPNIVFGPPYTHAHEPFLRWWHVDVENPKREGSWFTPRDAKDCLVDFEFIPVDGGIMTRARGVWDTEKGPVAKKTIRAGKNEPPSPVAVVIRSSQEHPLYGVLMGPGVVYISGYQFLTQQNGVERLPIGNYIVKVIVSSGQQVWSADRFYLEIRDTGLAGFVVSERTGNL